MAMNTSDGGSSRARVIGDLVAVGGCSLVVFALALHFNVPGRLGQKTPGADAATRDALVFFFAILAIGLIIFTSRRLRDTVRQSEQAAARRALYDPLTALPNRILLHERLTDALVDARQRDGRVAVLFLDLDRFKSVNDNYGHACGDHLLTAVADRLREAVRTEDLLARLGGDEFVVICHDITYHGEAETIAERILDSLSRPFDVKNGELKVTTSVGIALSENTGRGRKESAETLLHDADVAMYRAKADAPGTYAMFDRSMKADRVNRDKAEKRLEQALDGNEFRLHYQPIISVEDEHVVGVEALIRWQDPNRGMIQPGEFISQLEDSGLIVPVGEWALEEACRQVKAWTDRYPDIGPLVASVNVSPRQLLQGDFGDTVTKVLHRTGARPTQLCLEITEAALMGDVVAAWAQLRKVKALGVTLAIDDFGTGYSSVSYVRNFALDALKIDQSFVRGLASGVEDAAIVKAVIHMAHALGLATVAEGVETPEQLAELRSLGCDKAQGYLF
ncbi:MAG: diguanylate cyclase/phosphodiesterase with and sensor(s), partial [Acidimicrobiales bacterium]|nr:diguanylate cyclase/phosphodiesterase with and sensor(s) [Acidimicrobiales bacterium]